MGAGTIKIPEGLGGLEDCPEPGVFLIEYTDGFRAATLMLDGYLNAFAFAGRRAGGAVEACECFTQEEGPFAHFGYLCSNITSFFQTGVAPYPVERTVTTTVIIDAVMNSRYERGEDGVGEPRPALACLAFCASAGLAALVASPLRKACRQRVLTAVCCGGRAGHRDEGDRGPGLPLVRDPAQAPNRQPPHRRLHQPGRS